MIRKLVAAMALALAVSGILACGGESKPKVSPAKVKQAQAQLAEMQGEMEALAQQVEESIVQAHAEQLRLQAQLKEIQAGFENLNARSQVVGRALGAAQTKAQAAKAAKVARGSKEKTGWHWSVRLLLVVVFLLLVYAFIRRHTHSGDDLDSEFDDEVVEESELGEIRYPGSAQQENEPEAPQQPEGESPQDAEEEPKQG